jgi:predicted Zn-dependent protease
MLEKRVRELLLSCRERAARRGIHAELSYHRESSGLIRLGNSSVALSTHEELARLDVTVQDGRRVGSTSLCSDITGLDQLEDALERAREACASALPKDYEPIFAVLERSWDDSSGFDPELERLDPERKTRLCAEVVKAFGGRGAFDFSGSWSTGSTELYLVSTANDNEAYRRLTDGRFVMVLQEREKKWELQVERTQKRAGSFDAAELIAQLEAELPVYEGNPGYRTRIGHQRVLFAAQAVSSLLSLAIRGGFFGRGWEEKRAYTSALKPGDRLFSDPVTIFDDPADPNTFGMPFDFSGKKRDRFLFVERGTFRGVSYATQTAARYGRPPTGHDLGSWDAGMAAGDGPADFDGARRLAGDALFIPHLHYLGMPDPTKGLFTGSSRFGAMRIQGGERAAPLLSSRVTDTVPNVLGHVLALSSRTVPVNESSTYGRRSPEATSVPEWILCDNVRISDVAEGF